MNALAADPVATVGERLLKRAGLSPAGLRMEALAGGRNNRVWALHTDEGRWLLKRYFHHPSDSRDRLAHEFEFLKFLSNRQIFTAPKPLASEPSERWALLEYISGSTPTLEAVSAYHIQQASAFIIEINKSRMTESAAKLRPASEACFSISDHLTATQRRVERLSLLPSDEAIDREARTFALEELLPTWTAVRDSINNTSTNLQGELAAIDRCLSPSDFGFHNSIIEASGRVRFVDFEYAGWDDPAKLICDFSNQPDMLLDRDLSNVFRRDVISFYPNSEALAARVRLLEPVYQIKWACICLNLFLPAGRQRHQFTHQNFDADGLQRRHQLSKARLMLSRAISNS